MKINISTHSLNKKITDVTVAKATAKVKHHI